MGERVFLNGKIIDAAEARVSIFDAGLVHAVGLFETMRAYGGRIMRMSAHLDRLAKSAAALEMQVQVDHARIESGIGELLAANDLTDARLRLTMTPGELPREQSEGNGHSGATLIITAGPVKAYPAELYQHGMRVCVCPYKQSRFDPLAGHKTLSYFPRLLAMKYAAQQKCNEALWFNTDNQLAEGSVCNVFLVRGGTVMTPPLDTPALAGTVRDAVLEVGRKAGMSVEERVIDIEMLLSAEEVFLTGSVLEVMPVTGIEKHQVGTGAPGDVTQMVSTLYRKLVDEECGAR
jgi:branched-chain amino acid aminotransferase